METTGKCLLPHLLFWTKVSKDMLGSESQSRVWGVTRRLKRV